MSRDVGPKHSRSSVTEHPELNPIAFAFPSFANPFVRTVQRNDTVGFSTVHHHMSLGVNQRSYFMFDHAVYSTKYSRFDGNGAAAIARGIGEMHEDEDEVSTGHSPLDATGVPDELPSSPTPAKKRRLNIELDDTASSASQHEEGGNQLKRKRMIQDTVEVLRRIIPGAEGKGAASVIDEAIGYLMSFKLKAEKKKRQHPSLLLH